MTTLTQSPPNLSTSYGEPPTLTESQEAIATKLDVEIEAFQASVHQARDLAELAFLRSVYIGANLSTLHENMKKERQGAVIGFDDLCFGRWGIQRRSANNMVKIGRAFGKYLVVTEGESTVALQWSDDLPTELRALSTRAALKCIADQKLEDEGNQGTKRKKEKTWLETTYRLRATLCKELETTPIQERGPEQAYELLEAVEPILKIASDAKAIALQDPNLKHAVASIKWNW